MPKQGISKKLPKRTANAHAKEYRSRAWTRGEQRKAERRAENDARHAANVAAGKLPKVRKAKRDNMKYCDRCAIGGPRLIVCGQVCVCVTIGSDRVSQGKKPL